MAMKTYYPTLLSLIFVLYAVHTHAQKIENLPVMKQQSQNELFHRLDKDQLDPYNGQENGVMGVRQENKCFFF